MARLRRPTARLGGRGVRDPRREPVLPLAARTRPVADTVPAPARGRKPRDRGALPIRASPDLRRGDPVLRRLGAVLGAARPARSRRARGPLGRQVLAGGTAVGCALSRLPAVSPGDAAAIRTLRCLMSDWPEPVERVASFIRSSGTAAIIEEFPEGTPTARDAARAVG